MNTETSQKNTKINYSAKEVSRTTPIQPTDKFTSIDPHSERNSFVAERDSETHVISKNKLSSHNLVTDVLWWILIFSVYYLAGKFGLTLAFENESATAVWAPSGIALAVFLLKGYKYWPAILIGAFAINITTTGYLPSSILIAIGNTAEGVLAAYLVNRFADGKYSFEKTQSILKFALFAGIISPVISATVGVTSLAASGLAEWDRYLSIWVTWWLGDAAGIFMITPLVVLWYLHREIVLNKEKILEGLSIAASLVVICFVIFSPYTIIGREHSPFNYILIPPFVWIAFRFSKRIVSFAALSVCSFAIWGTLNGYGPFVTSSLNESLIFLQAFICIITIFSLCFASTISERNRIESQVRKNEKELRDFVENASVGLHWVGPDGKIIWANKAELDLLGYTKEEYFGRHISEFHSSKHDIEIIMQKLTNNETLNNYEAKVNCKDGSIKDVLISSNSYFVNGEFVHTRCFTKDITDKKRIETEKIMHVRSLAEAERRRRLEFQKFLERLPAGAYTCNNEGLITFYNEAAVKIWGRAPKLNNPSDRYCGSFKLYVDDNPIKHELCWMALAINNNTSYDDKEIIIERPDGSRITVTAHANPIHDESGSLIGAVNILVDISERKISERLLKIQYSITKALAESDTFDEALQKVLYSICEGLGWPLGMIWLVDNEEGVLRFGNGWFKGGFQNVDPGMYERTFKKGIGLPGRVWKFNQPLWIPDVLKDDNFPRAVIAERMNLHAGLAFPVVNGNEVIAIIEAFDQKILEPSEESLDMLKASGRQIGIFLARKRAEEERKIARRTYQSLFESTLDGILIVDESGKYIDVNDSYCRMLKGSRQELIGKNFFNFIPAEFEEFAKQVFHELRNSGSFKGEFPILAMDGSIVQTEWFSKAYFLEGLHLFVARDITSRKESERKLEGEYIFRKTIENSQASGIAVIDNEGNQTYINPAFCKMLGWSESELIGAKPPFIYWPEEESAKIQQRFERALRGEQGSESFELVFCRKNGERFDVLINVTQIKGYGKYSGGWLASVTDISKIKKVENDLKEAHVRLEERVTERTIELNSLIENLKSEVLERKKAENELQLANEKLKEAQYELINSEKLASLGRFSSGIAHEIRNPLANISALAQLAVNKEGLNPELEQYLKYILENSDIANKIIKELLNVASPHNTKFRSSDIGDLLISICKLVESRCIKNNITLVTNIDDNLPNVYINEEKIRNAFLNFISNAIDSMQGKPGKLTISGRADFHNDELVFIFEDSGSGIPDEYLDKIFEPFFTTKNEGTGLGLSLSYHVIKAHSGKIEIQSKVNIGTSIKINLPINSVSNIDGKNINC